MVNNNNQTSTALATPATAPAAIASTTASTSIPAAASLPNIIIQMPSFQYPFNQQLDTPTAANFNLPSISEFLFSLDQKYNCDGVYSKFEDAFLNEEITVDAIKDLSDEQMQVLGIVKIGWQKNIRKVAQRY